MDPEQWDRMQNPQHRDKDKPGDGEKEENASSAGPWRPLPPQLENWRVMEVEGQAARIADDSPHAPSPQDSSAPLNTGRELTDHVDELIVLTIPDRRLVVASGGTGTMPVSLLNNGDQPLIFEVKIRGEAETTWFPEMPLRVPLQPGERKVFALQVAPSFGPQAEAGTYAFAVTATPVERPERYSRIVCVLTIDAYTDFRLGILQPERLTTSWWTPSAQAMLPITNLSNHEASFQIVGADQGRECIFEFDTPHDIFAQAGQATFVLGPGERRSIGVTILSRRQPTVSLSTQERPFRVAVQFVDDDGHDLGRDRRRDHRQVVEGQIVSAALIGPWQVAALAGIAAAVLAIIMLTSAVMLLALRTGEGQPVAMPTPPPAPAFALVLSMDEPVPTRELQAAPPAIAESTAATSAAPVVVAGPEQGGLPVVQADQVSSPGEEPAIPQPSPVRPTPVAVVPPSAGGMTYAQMFRQIAARYDLNWKMLAAQGYVESGFDSTAIGKQGSLGLMQVHPDTWQEWAPMVDVTDAFDTYSNVLVAAIYLDYLRATLGQQGRPQAEWMLAAYNWGPDKVLNLVAAGGGWTDLPIEVQKYATEVLRIAQSIPDN